MKPRDTMHEVGCEEAREAIPDVAAGTADVESERGVREHATACADCAGELELAVALHRSRVRVPVDLADRVVARVRLDRRTLRRPWWGISAAAVAALALGIGITSRSVPSEVDLFGTEFAVEDEEGELWLADDAILAGAPVFDELSDEALTRLLDELTAEPMGGEA